VVLHESDCKEVVVAREAPAACAKCGGKLEQDTDVLDTWSRRASCRSRRWAGRRRTRDLDVFYPNSLMITGSTFCFLGGADDHAGVLVHDAAA